MPDSTGAGAREVMVAGYEELRGSALNHVRGSGRGIGFALFVRSGMAAWIKTCAALPRPSEASAWRPTAEGRRFVPQDLRVEVANLLAEMALSAHAQGAMGP